MSQVANVKMWLAGALTAAMAIVVPAPAQAGHRTPIECAAHSYREAVRKFEHAVIRCSHVARCDERLVDDLEDSTSRLLSASRNLCRLERLFCAYAETCALHERVEQVFFTRSHYPPHPKLQQCWELVAYTYQDLAREIQCLKARGADPGVHPGHVGSFPGYPRGKVNFRMELNRRYPIETRYPSTRALGGFGSVYAPEPALSPFAPRPALDPRANRPALDPRAIDPRRGGPSAVPPPPSVTTAFGNFQPARTATPAPRNITSRDDLRAVLVGAALQRLLQ